MTLTKREREKDDPDDDLPEMLESETNRADRNNDFAIAALGVTFHFPKLKPNITSLVPTVGEFIGRNELINGESKLNILVTLLEKYASCKATNKLRPVPEEVLNTIEESEIQFDAMLIVLAMLDTGVEPKDEN